MNAFARHAKHVFLPLDEIDISHAIRPYNATVVGEIARSIREIGLQTPLTCIVRDGQHILVSGRNRLEALRSIGAEQAPVRVVDFTDIEAQLWRFSENLHRAELTKLEYDKPVVQYAELLKVKQAGGVAAPHPEADKVRQVGAVYGEEGISRQVGAKVSPQGNVISDDGQSRQLGANEATGHRHEGDQSAPLESKRADGRGHRPESGYRQAARELNIPEQTVRRAYQTASLSPEAQTTAVETGVDDNRAALLEAAKERTPEAQMATIRRLAERKASPAEPTSVLPAPPAAKPLRDLVNISAGELARWIKITTPNDRPHVIRVLRMAADILEDELGGSAPVPVPTGNNADPHDIEESAAAIAFLEDELARGPRNAADVESAAAQAGLTVEALARARAHLSVRSRQLPGCPRRRELPNDAVLMREAGHV
jgi:ParB-like nuclease domain